METQIRKFHQLSLDELYQILKLRIDVFVVEQECAYPELDNKDQEAHHIFILDDHVISSYLRIYYPKSGRAAIGRVVTPETHRGRGLSRTMMEAALDFLKQEEGLQTIYLQAQVYLSAFYESFGFQKTSDPYLEDGIPHVDMEMNIEV